MRNLAPFLTAINEAIKSQVVYWVDWSTPLTAPYPPSKDVSLFDRLLKAIQDGHVV